MLNTENEEGQPGGGQEENASAEMNDPIRNSDDLEKEKRAARDFFAENNIGGVQFFIQSMSSLNFGHSPTPAGTGEKAPNRTYRLECPEDCSAFVECYKDSQYVVTALVLSAFELVRLSELPKLTDTLTELLPTAVPADAENPPARTAADPYVSIDTILLVIGGKRFVTKEGLQCLKLEKDPQQVLRNFWEQFPMLRGPVSKWLVQVCRSSKFRTAFDLYQLVVACSRVISLDFQDAKEQIFPLFYSDPSTTSLLANIVGNLYEDAALRQDLDNMILDWLCSSGVWLWRPACLACSFLMPVVNLGVLEPHLEKAVRKRLTRMTKSDSVFAAVLLGQSEYFRTLFAKLFGQAVQNAHDQKGRMDVAQTYLYLLRNCYYMVDSSQPELPLAMCDNVGQQRSLTPILRQIMSTFSLRRQLYAVLRAYLNEISRYPDSSWNFNHICAYFYNMARSAPECWQDVLRFLAECKNMLARRIYDQLFPLCQNLPQFPNSGS